MIDMQEYSKQKKLLNDDQGRILSVNDGITKYHKTSIFHNIYPASPMLEIWDKCKTPQMNRNKKQCLGGGIGI